MIINVHSKLKALEKAKSMRKQNKPVGMRLNVKLWKEFQAAVKANSAISANKMVEVLMQGYLDEVSNKPKK